jgi:arsenate reductase
MSDSRVTIYHNPRCTRSRQTLQLIQDAGVEPEIVEYLKSTPTAEEIDGILKKLKLEPLDAMRRKEAVFKELGLSSDTPRDEAISAMAENPILIERPIVVRGRKAVIGRPPENVNELLG